MDSHLNRHKDVGKWVRRNFGPTLHHATFGPGQLLETCLYPTTASKSLSMSLSKSLSKIPSKTSLNHFVSSGDNLRLEILWVVATNWNTRANLCSGRVRAAQYMGDEAHGDFWTDRF